MICEGLRTLLLAESTVTAVTSKIYVTAARQNATAPYIVLDRIEDTKFSGLGGYLSARKCEVDIECWDTTPSDAAALSKIVGAYLDDFTGATGGSETILSCHEVGGNDTFATPKSGEEITEFVSILNYEFLYTE